MIHNSDLEREMFSSQIFSVGVFASLLNVAFWIFYFFKICWNVKFESLCPFKIVFISVHNIQMLLDVDHTEKVYNDWPKLTLFKLKWWDSLPCSILP